MKKPLTYVIIALIVIGFIHTVTPKKENVTVKVGDVSVTIPVEHLNKFMEGVNSK